MNRDANWTVPGFRAAGIASGIKEDGRKDLALIVSDEPASAAGMFTTNAFKAAPVIVDMERIRSGRAQAILTNSGNANAAMGPEGIEDARASSRAVSEELGIPDGMILLASTGVIGRRLPVGKILAGIGPLAGRLRVDGMEEAQEAMLTTDRFPKMALRAESIDGRPVTVLGMAKGAGMIQPDMATMLAYVLTDAVVEPRLLGELLREGVAGSFNAISVDGCMSTNDTALILANGRAGNATIISPRSRAFREFQEMLLEVTIKLARDMVRDGEGATKVIEITVEQARTSREAREMAYAIANSNLVKTAFFGGDPNWGRIIAAAGAVGIPLPVDKVELYLDEAPLFRRGRKETGKETLWQEIMSREEIRVLFRAGMGEKSCRVFASDLGFEYIKINAHYHT